jgi:hypothetical protein
MPSCRWPPWFDVRSRPGSTPALCGRCESRRGSPSLSAAPGRRGRGRLRLPRSSTASNSSRVAAGADLSKSSWRPHPRSARRRTPSSGGSPLPWSRWRVLFVPRRANCLVARAEREASHGLSQARRPRTARSDRGGLEKTEGEPRDFNYCRVMNSALSAWCHLPTLQPA